VKIVVDAMGGDHAPRVVVEGVALALQHGLDPATLILVGRSEALTPLLEEFKLERRLEVLHAAQVIEMHESPAAAIRSKTSASIVVGMKAVKEGKASGFVSAGNTGAVVSAAQLILGRLPTVSRPGIAVPVPTREGPCTVIDVGANIYCKPIHMLQYAIMASEYAKGNFGRVDPAVGLLNIGAEEGKGNPLILEAHELLQASRTNYKGFIEGQDIMSGAVDVVVCEGFVGNVILKVAEGLATFVAEQVHAAFAAQPPNPAVKSALAVAFSQLDYAEYGGAPLLGVTAPVLIGHGRSSAHAIMNMIKTATNVIRYDVTRRITDQLASGSGAAPA